MHLVRRFYKSQLVRGSFFIFLAQNAANFGNFLYNLLMGRLLSAADYGNLGALLSFLSILAMPLAVFQLFIVKTVSSLSGKNDLQSTGRFISQMRWKVALIAVFSGLILYLAGQHIVRFLRLIDILPFYLIILMLVISPPAVLNRSVLHGLLKFPLLALNSLVEICLKLAVSVILVVFQFGLFGALFGTTIGALTSFILTAIELKLIFKGSAVKNVDQKTVLPKWNEVFPVALTTAALTIFFSMDVVLVRHFFDDLSAGQYVALSTLGRIPFYMVGPIVSVMFPIISGRVSNKSPYMLPLLGSLVLSLCVSLLFIFIYFFAPKLVITLFYGNRFLEVAPIMGIFAFFMSLYSLNSILTYFLLSVSTYKPLYILFFISLSPSVLIFINHQSLTVIVLINIFVSLIYLSFAAFFVYQKEKKYIYNIIGKISSL